MLLPRVIPCLLLRNGGLVKTKRFANAQYVGDPRNVVKIFNEKEVDELLILDITATPERRAPNIGLIREIVSEAFMPVAYGGGIRTVSDAKSVLAAGVEKIVVSSQAVERPDFIAEAAAAVGSQSVVVCIDAKKTLLRRQEVYTEGGRKAENVRVVEFARRMEAMGAGELIVQSIDRDGTMEGYDIELIRSVSNSVDLPIVACGGAGKLEDFRLAVREGGASAAAAGSFFVFHGKHRAVLVTYPSREELERVLA